jgi:hypothetical protein
MGQSVESELSSTIGGFLSNRGSIVWLQGLAHKIGEIAGNE